MKTSNPLSRRRAQRPEGCPWRAHNRFRLLVDGGRFFPAILAAIDRAQHYIFMEMYLFESGAVATRVQQRLLDAAGRGVGVYLLLDDYGSLGLSKADRQRLTAGGVRLTYYNPLRVLRWQRNLLRDHRKLVLIDGVLAYTGGAGITDAFDPDVHPRHYWHEVMVAIQGPVVADWQALFQQVWQNTPAATPLPSLRQPGNTGTQRGRVMLSRAGRRSALMRSLITHTRAARQRVWLATAYFVPSWKLRRALRHTARRGVDVRIMVPGAHSDHPWVRYMGRRYYDRLLRNGVRIYEYQPRFLHAKVMLCDHWVSIGSSNADHWNLHWNLEANQEIDDAGFAEEVAAWFQHDLPACTEMRYAHWRKRPWSERLREAFWNRIARLAAWLSSKRGPGP